MGEIDNLHSISVFLVGEKFAGPSFTLFITVEFIAIFDGSSLHPKSQFVGLLLCTKQCLFSPIN